MEPHIAWDGTYRAPVVQSSSPPADLANVVASASRVADRPPTAPPPPLFPTGVVGSLPRPLWVLLDPNCGFAPGSAFEIPLDEAYLKLKHEAEAARLLRSRYAAATHESRQA